MLDTEILNGFREESNQLTKELMDVVEKLEDVEKEDPFPGALLEEFSQKVDRIMGAAKTISMFDPDHQGLKRIAAIAELSKRLGYRAAEQKRSALVPIFAGFWADTTEVLQELIEVLDDEVESARLAKAFSSVVEKRLQWLSDQMTAQPVAGAPATDEAFDAADFLKNFQF